MKEAWADRAFAEGNGSNAFALGQAQVLKDLLEINYEAIVEANSEE